MPEREDFHGEPEFQKALKEIQNARHDENLIAKTRHQHHSALPVDLAGQRLGEYQIQKKIGEGGMGVVYQALHVELGKQVAIKFLSGLTRDKNAAQRFQSEIKTLAMLDHPNLVRATDARTFDGNQYLVTEYVQGLNLESLVNRIGPLESDIASEIIRQIANGLENAHSKGIVHRDIKPKNVILTPDGIAKILDLGLARLAQDSVTNHLTDSNQIVGTVDFMSPEQIDPKEQVHFQSDLYSLGCTFIFLLTGEAPFADVDGPVKKMMAHMNTPIEPIVSLQGKPLGKLIDSMVAKKPAERVQSAQEVAGQLKTVVDPDHWNEFIDVYSKKFDNLSDNQQVLVATKTISLDTHKDCSDAGDRQLINETPSSQTSSNNFSYFGRFWLATALALGFLLVAYGVVITFKTDKGTLVFELEDGVNFEFANNLVNLQDSKTGKNFSVALKEIATLSQGNYEINELLPSYEMAIVDAEGTEFRTPGSFKIQRGAETRIKIYLKTTENLHLTKTPQNTNPTSPESERDLEQDVALWAIRNGARLQVSYDRGTKGKHINAIQDLPNDFKITRLDVYGLRQFDDEWAQKAAKLTSLIDLNCGATSVTDASLTALGQCESLLTLFISNLDEFTQQGFRDLANSRTLRHMEMINTFVDDGMIRELAKINSLRTIELQGPKVNDETLKLVVNLPNLKKITIAQAEVTDEVIDIVGQSKSLKTLYLKYCRGLSDDLLRRIVKFPHIDDIYIEGIKITDNGVRDLKGSSITKLTFSDTRVTTKCLDDLLTMQKLTQLSFIQDDKFVGHGIGKLSKLSRLSVLTMWASGADDQTLAEIQNLQGLDILDVRENNVTEDAIAKLRDGLPHTTIYTGSMQ